MIRTGVGSWAPQEFLFGVLALALIVFIISSLGERKCKKEKDKVSSFYSGDRPPEGNRATGIYWGFFKALDRYYRWTKKAHNGIVNDYAYWFVFLLTGILCVVVLL
jgi:hypothetical protein